MMISIIIFALELLYPESHKNNSMNYALKNEVLGPQQIINEIYTNPKDRNKQSVTLDNTSNISVDPNLGLIQNTATGVFMNPMMVENLPPEVINNMMNLPRSILLHETRQNKG